MRKLITATLLATLMAGSALADTKLKLVEVITSPERTETLKSIVAKFEAANPGTTVEIISLPWGEAFQKFATMVSAGEIPDVMEMPDTWLSLYANNGMLESLEPYLKTWDQTPELTDRALELGRDVKDTAYMLPYGFYLRAMFYNKKIFAEAGVDGPPKTMDDFVAAAEKIKKLPGKYAYCMRGGPGGLNGWMMMGATMAGDNTYFNADGTSKFSEEGWVKGFTWLIDLYKNGYAPKDSVSWGFNEVVTGFYSGTCAMLDQDPDALIGIAEKMKPEDFGVAPLPTGPNGKSYPTLGYAGWAMFANSKVKDEAWKLMGTLLSPADNLEFAKNVGVLPIHNGADKDPYFGSESFKGWFQELSDPKTFEFVTPPTHLENLGNFYDSVSVKNFQEVLLGQKTPKAVADEWAAFLTEQQQAWMAKNKK